MDNLTKRQRSLCMSKIRSKWTSQEKKIHGYLKAHKIKHKMHPKIEGNPDILLTDKKTAVFLHGCFWHKCPKHYIKPKSNKVYWIKKIDSNVKRFKKVRIMLRNKGYNVIRLWEHEIKKDTAKSINKLYK